MDALTTTAPRAIPQVREPKYREFFPSLPDHWNRLRAAGPPEWLDRLGAATDILAPFAKAHADVQLSAVADPTGASDIELLRIDLGAPDKPAMLVVSGQHGREPATPVATVDWVHDLLAARDAGDPQAEWLLTNRRIVVLPEVNPRGLQGAVAALRAAAAGPPSARRYPDQDDAGSVPGPFGDYMRMRRNQSTPDGGVDLNRNHRATWKPADTNPDPVQLPDGTTFTPRPVTPTSEIWPGPAAASEPETRIIDSVIDDVAPNVVVDMHQFSNYMLVSAPSSEAAQDLKDGFRYLGDATRIKALSVGHNNSPPGTLQGQGATHADVGVTVELGRSFITTDHVYREVRKDAARLLTAFARAADAPGERLRGPAVSSAARPTKAGWNIGASDTRTGAEALLRAEIVTDPDAAPGSGTALEAADGAFDEPFETLRLPRGAVQGDSITIRAQDVSGAWGPVTAVELPDSNRR